jgi:hypothetical protein
VHVALAQDDVVVAPDLDLVAVLGVEQHPVAHLHGPDVGADGHDLGPRQPLRHLGGGGDEDAARRRALSLGARRAHQHAVVEHLDGQLVGRAATVVVDLRGGGRRLGHENDATVHPS